MVDLNKLAAEIHEAAVKKGFWSVEDAENKHLAKMISELGEVVQADRAGVMYEIEHEGAKPEGVVAELADFVMMALDFAVVFEQKLPDADISEWDELNIIDVDSLVQCTAYDLVTCLAMTLLSSSYASDGDNEIETIIYMVYSWVHGNGFDLWDVIRQKMAYNESRPALHGRAY